MGAVQKTGNALLYGFRILLIILFFASLGEYPPAAPLFLLSFLFTTTLPEKITGKKEKSMKGKKIAAATVLLIAGIVLLPGQADNMANEGIPPATYKNEELHRNLLKGEETLVEAMDSFTGGNYAASEEKSLEAMEILGEVYTGTPDENIKRDAFNYHLLSLMVHKTAKLIQQKEKELKKAREKKAQEALPTLEILARAYRENSEDWKVLADTFQTGGEEEK